MPINEFLPKKKPAELVLVQAKVPSELRKIVKMILKSRHLTWNDLIVAAMREIVAEEGL